jgi:hypothetical protein
MVAIFVLDTIFSKNIHLPKESEQQKGQVLGASSH